MKPKPEISVILPCLNEEKAIGLCLEEAVKVILEFGLDAEIIVVDNGSTDKSAAIVLSYAQRYPQIKLVNEPVKGYGSACLCGFSSAQGQYFFIADADCTYDFSQISSFIEELKSGEWDMVVGNRFTGQMQKKSMPWLHKYVGNPAISFLARVFFGFGIKDINCGARAISKKSLSQISLSTTGMEFASEMVIKAAKGGLKIKQLPAVYRRRVGESKLKSFPDGLRHLKLILFYSPNFLWIKK